jgi:hypothetical protein
MIPISSSRLDPRGWIVEQGEKSPGMVSSISVGPEVSAVTVTSSTGFGFSLARPKSKILAWPRLVTKYSQA